ncbi:uncharacterized protein LOC110827256 isoform X2 [Zootermopsis nevadensis]|uniref:uncharacterized protein LOC110827256 isoform X2 n=1 Tax=Zootermopsis nevadensis TaxID=136037 RepID=UPI000B8ED1BC|nr:uncharacterized protein LOC110827256 isoform X2 [Zootermopsis nevadensis]
MLGLGVYRGQTFHPYDGEDLQKIIYEAKENGLKIKYNGGSFPVVNSDGTEIIINLDNMRRVICYDPEEQTFTVEGGLTMAEMLQSMEFLNFTLEMYGIIPNMTIADAISVGLTGSNGTIANCLLRCQVLYADGSLIDLVWPGPDEVPNRFSNIPTERLIPTLQTVVCGLGLVGVIYTATFKCTPIHLAQETVYECPLSDIANNWQQLLDGLYGYLYWYPLLDRVIIKRASSVRFHLGHWQPWWKKCVEIFYWSIHWLVNRASPYLAWYVPSFTKKLSQMQFNLAMKASSCRMQHSFRPQLFISVGSYCRGIEWTLPAEKLQNVVQDIGNWAEHRFYLCSTPILITVQTHQALTLHHPHLCPYSERRTCTLWTDWFNSRSITSNYSANMAEFEALLQKNGGRKCWSAGPVYASPLIGRMYHGYRQWCDTRKNLDPSAMFRSAYVAGLPRRCAAKNELLPPQQQPGNEGEREEVLKPTRRRSQLYDEDFNKFKGNGVQMSDTADTIKGPETDLPGKASLRQRVRLEDCYTWQCTDCPTVLATLQELKDHHHLVHDQAVHFQCVECAKVYTVYKKFTRHVRLHRNHGNYRCRDCGKSFSSKQAMENHAVLHSDARPHSCSDCGKTFRQIGSLYSHRHVHQADQNGFSCSTCGKLLLSQQSLEVHRKTHSGVRDYTCDACGKSFAVKQGLVYHMMSHSGERPHCCHLCGKRCKTVYLLNKHVATHSNVKVHQCDVCGKQFRESGTLKLHTRIHTGARPYCCEFCGRHFRFQGVYVIHKRQHTGERPYSCGECKRDFTNWANYNKHTKCCHGGKCRSTLALAEDQHPPACNYSSANNKQNVHMSQITDTSTPVTSYRL